MPKTIAQLIAELKPDPWRTAFGFSPEMNSANEQLFVSNDPADSATILNQWIQKNQPCLFGRVAATVDVISYCILTEADLLGSEELLLSKIQAARTEWTREGYYGRKSAFIILAISRAITNAIPNDSMKELAIRLCSFYLQTEARENVVLLEDIFLEMPGQRQTTWRWRAGVNYFCAQGDGRWWRDHRIPGGIAFSVNSIGHMVKSGKLAAAMQHLGHTLDAPPEDWEASKIDSLGKALILAMRTIANSSIAVSGKAIELIPLPEDPTELPIRTCPVKLPSDLANKNFCEYRGYYHTDFSLPGEFFQASVERQEGAKVHVLDFTYLFHKSVDNPAFFTMGEGQKIRAEGPHLDHEQTIASSLETSFRRLKGTEETVLVTENERLRRAISA